MQVGMNKYSEIKVIKILAIARSKIGVFLLKIFMIKIARMIKKTKPIITASKIKNSFMYPKAVTATSTESKLILFQNE
jgi:hypothetical protein